MNLQNIYIGSHLSIFDGSDGSRKLLAVGKCVERLSTGVRLCTLAGVSSQGFYSFKTGYRRESEGKTRYAEPLAEDKVKETKQRITEQGERERDERYKTEDEKRQREYDALPEGIKLARSLRWICAVNSEAKIAAAPIELLRGIDGWAKENNLETE